MSSIKLFETRKLSSVWDEDPECYFFSVVDVVGVLIDSPNARKYWGIPKIRRKKKGSELATNFIQRKMCSADKKITPPRLPDTEQLLYLVQSIPSPKAEPFKQWLARVGYQRIEETDDPELAPDRTMAIYINKGYSRDWINQRLKSIEVRKEIEAKSGKPIISAKNVKPNSIKGCFAETAYVDFGSKVWTAIQAQPLGNLTKHEPELTLQLAVNDAGRLDAEPSKLAQTCRIPLTRAHGYLTDLTLRKEPLLNPDAVAKPVELLCKDEVVKDDTHLSLPLHDTALRIWLEQKMATLSLNAGDTVCKDLINLTPAGLAKPLGASNDIATPYEGFRSLPPELKRQAWANEAEESCTKASKWPEAISALANTPTIAQTILPASSRVLGA